MQKVFSSIFGGGQQQQTRAVTRVVQQPNPAIQAQQRVAKNERDKAARRNSKSITLDFARAYEQPSIFKNVLAKRSS